MFFLEKIGNCKILLFEHIINDWREEMKKVLICLSALFLMAGCDNGTETLSCTSTNTVNGLTTDTTYDIKYKDDVVKYVTITYHYTQDDTTNNAADNNTDDGVIDDTTDDNATDNNTTDNDDVDGVDADTDGLDEDRDNDANNNTVDGDDIVDGVVGDAIDTTIDGVTSTILDIAGIRDTYQNQMSTYDNIEGFSYKVDTDNDNEYKIIYEIDFDKISDSDLTRFNVDRNFTTLRSNYEDLGYTCK